MTHLIGFPIFNPLGVLKYIFLLCRTPVTTVGSVLGLVYDGGIMISADMVGSYGSLARYRDCPRLMKINDGVALGAAGDYADFQYLRDIIEQKMWDHFTFFFSPSLLEGNCVACKLSWILIYFVFIRGIAAWWERKCSVKLYFIFSAVSTIARTTTSSSWSRIPCFSIWLGFCTTGARNSIPSGTTSSSLDSKMAARKLFFHSDPRIIFPSFNALCSLFTAWQLTQMYRRPVISLLYFIHFYLPISFIFFWLLLAKFFTSFHGSRILDRDILLNRIQYLMSGRFGCGV